jgi:hypothetical protein
VGADCRAGERTGRGADRRGRERTARGGAELGRDRSLVQLGRDELEQGGGPRVEQRTPAGP